MTHRTQAPSGESDWTIGPGGRTNTSAEFEALVYVVEQLIRNSAHTLISGGGPKEVARLIVAKLAHVHGLRLPEPTRRTT